MMRKPMPQGARARLLAGCALGACLAVLPSAAAAQALQGTPTTVAGSDPVFNTALNYTQVVIRSAETVINWEPFDNAAAGTIDFLPAGATAEFTEPSGTIDYTVLNRILPVDASGIPVSRPVAFNGTVIGLNGNAPGGQIWFYSPTGIIAGPTAVFNVGSLILTTNDIAFVPNTGGGPPGSIYGPGGLVQFQGPAGSTGFVEIQNGAEITATGSPFGPAYVALVAPRVVQAGQVSADGQIAYLAAEQVDMTINAGLFDFTLLVGTTDANGVVHTGTTTGPASTSAADLQRISMVALPKNDALTMLLAGPIGYTPAAIAANEGSSVVLAAGFDTDDPAVVPTNRFGSITIGTPTFSNALTGYATDAINVLPTAGGTASFGGATTLYAVNAIDATSSAATSITAASTLALRSGQPGTGGTINLSALSGGQVTAAGGFLLDASSGAANYDNVTPFVDAVGGIVNVLADAGTISTPLTFVANVGAIAGDDPGIGGQGSGGTIDLRLDNGGVVGAASMILTALGRGGGSAGTGGLGLGGTIAVLENSGQLDIGGLSLFAQGAGGDAAVRGGDGSGGFATIDLLGQAQDLDSLYVDASAGAGLPTDPAGSSGHASSSPDAVRLTVSGPASLAVQFGIELGADARSGIEVVPGLGGQAGGVALEAIGGGIIDAGSIDLHANTTIRPDTPDIVPVNSPLQQGGFVNVLTDTGGSIVAQTLSASATATGHEATGSAGTATGGTAQVMATNGGSITVDDGLGTALLTVIADAYGSPGPIATDAFGGTARLVVEDGSITVAGDAMVSASAGPIELSAATAGEGFGATGGSATLEMLAGTLGTGSINTASLSILANGDARLLVGAPPPGGSPIQGDGGNGTGGTAQATIAAGTLTTGRLLLESAGTGGASAATDAAIAFQSGDGQGGSSLFAQSGGAATITTLDLLSNGIGGSGAPDAAASELAALAGNGTGGIAALDMIAGLVDAIDTTIEASGTGGAGMGHGGTGDATDGGFGTGGTAALRSPAGGSGSFSSGALAIRSNGTGGVGGNSIGGFQGAGGAGTGFSAAAALADGSLFLGDVIVEASGTGGNGANNGGTGTGGQATFALVDTSGPSGVRQLNGLTVEANGNAGLTTGGFPDQSQAGGVLLDVRVLDAASPLTVNGSVVLNSRGGVIGAPSGVTIAVAGAPLRIGGNFTVEAGDIAIDADAPLLAAADAFLSAERTYVSTGLVGSDSALTVQAGLGTTAERLSSGSTAFLSGVSGPLVVADLASGGEVTAFGSSVDIRSLGALQFASATATAGDLFIETVGDLGATSLSATGSISLETSAGNVATGDFAAGTWAYVDAFGSASLGNITAETDAAVTTRGGNLTVGNVTAGDDLWLSIFGTDATRVLTAGDLVTTGLGADGADGPPELFGGPGPTGNVARLRSSGSLVVGDIQSPGRAILVADAGTTTAGSLSANEALILLGRGDIALDSIATEGRFYVADSAMFAPNLPDAYDPASLDGLTPLRTSGGLTIGGAAQAGDITVAVAGSATAPSWTSAAGLLIDAGGQFASSVAVSAVGNVSITADNGIDLAALTSGGTTLLRAPLGEVGVGELLSTGAVTARGRSVAVASTGGLDFAEATATAGGVTILTDDFLNTQTVTATGFADLRTDGTLHAAGDVTAAAIDLRANVDIVADSGLLASGNLSVTARGTFTLAGLARGTSIGVSSGNIALGTGASLGSRGLTSDLTLTNLNVAAVMNIGGEAQAGYSLDQAEAARLFADNSITFGIAALPLEPGYGRIAVGDLALTFGATGNIGTGGQLEISTPAEISITGDVALTTSGADDTFLIDPTLIEIDTSTGSIALLSATGNPLGRLELVGDTTAIASTSALTQLRTLTDMAAINALLDTPGGTGTPLRAGTIAVSADDALFIQNSGASSAFADRRGFAAGALEITTASPSTRIAINGQILTAAGPVSGLETAPLLRINGAAPAAGGQFDAASTINGCVIGGDCAPSPEPEFFPPTSEDIESPVSEQGEGSLFVAPLIELADTEPLITPPLVDEPITGVGNDDLWEPRCEPGEEGGTCPEEDGQP